jgi:hypothetical protein
VETHCQWSPWSAVTHKEPVVLPKGQAVAGLVDVGGMAEDEIVGVFLLPESALEHPINVKRGA